MLYLDASALVKRYVSEDGSDAVVDAMSGASALSMCRIGFVETLRAVGQAGERGDVRRFEKDWLSFDVVEVDRALTESAAELALVHGLRSLDALHLAAALVLPSRDLTLATWDVGLLRAARDQGLDTLPVALG